MGTNTANGLTTTTEPQRSQRNDKGDGVKKPTRRQVQAELNKKLALKKCRHCSTVGKWKIASTQKRIRYVRCEACGKLDQLIL